jgi:hypothetical protein
LSLRKAMKYSKIILTEIGTAHLPLGGLAVRS